MMSRKPSLRLDSFVEEGRDDSVVLMSPKTQPSTPGSCTNRRTSHQPVFFPSPEPDMTVPVVSREDIKDNKLLIFCNIVSTVTAVSGLSSALLHFFVLIFEKDNWVYDDWISHISIAASHIYLVIFGCLIVLNERGYSKIRKNFAFLELWVGRGLFYILCAIWLYITTLHISDKHEQKVQPMEVPLPEDQMGSNFEFPMNVDADAPGTEVEETITVKAARLLVDSLFESARAGTVLVLLGCGLLYVCMGALCIGYFRDIQMHKIRDRKQIQLQSERLKKHKQDLDILIQETDRKLQNV